MLLRRAGLSATAGLSCLNKLAHVYLSTAATWAGLIKIQRMKYTEVKKTKRDAKHATTKAYSFVSMQPNLYL